MVKFFYRNTECTFVQMMSTFFATSVLPEQQTCFLALRMLETWKHSHHVWNEQTADDIKIATGGQITVTGFTSSPEYVKFADLKTGDRFRIKGSASNRVLVKNAEGGANLEDGASWFSPIYAEKALANSNLVPVTG